MSFVRNIAHRGASAYAPENTTQALDLAIDMGADAIETDVQLTRDGHLVLFHDTTIERTSNGTGRIGDHSLADLQALDCGSWFSPECAGARMLKLHDALESFLHRIPFVLEIKDPKAALPMIETIPIVDRIEITSFDWDALILARDRVPHFRFGFLTPRFDDDEIDHCITANLQQICPHADTVTPELVSAAHQRGLDVRAWGISHREQITHLQATGVDGTTCNWPDWLT
jgi:glycerophosphoryl diester phosphodiesterase